MSFGPADFAGFGGLDLRDPEDAQGSPDLLNVQFGVQGGVLSPYPGGTLIGSLNHYYPDSIYWSDATSRLLVAGVSTNLAAGYIRAETTGGTSTAVTTSYNPGSLPWTIIDSLGGSSPSPAAYAANGENVLVRYRSGTLTTLSASCSTKTAAETSFSAYSRSGPAPNCVCVQNPDKRLVAAGTDSAGGPNGVTSNDSYVWFSQPGNAEKWDETDFVDLGDDGQKITAAVSWGNLVFVFKKTKFVVFYGNSTDSTGGAVFNYRTVDNAFPGNDTEIFTGNIVVAPDGLYVWTAQGVFFTAGGPPRLVSEPIQRMFTSTVSGYSPTTTSISQVGSGTGGAFYYKGMLYWTGIGGSGGYWYTLRDGRWSRWDGPGYGLATNNDVLYTAAATGIYSLSNSTVPNNASYYTSAYLAYGEAKAEKHVRASELHGTGTVTLAWGKDLQTHGTAETVAMSSGIGHARTGARGRVLSFKIAGAAGAAWTVNRVVPLLQTVRTGK